MMDDKLPLTIAFFAASIINLIYCAITVRDNLSRGESRRAGFGVLASLLPLAWIGWAIMLWSLRNMPG